MDNNTKSWYQNKLNEQSSIAQDIASKKFQMNEQQHQEEKNELYVLKEEIHIIREELKEIKTMNKVLQKVVNDLLEEREYGTDKSKTGYNDRTTSGNSEAEQSSNDANNG